MEKVPTSDDIEEVKGYTDQKLGEIVINDASLTDKGVVQLSNAVDGTREDVAATEKAVRDARVEVAAQAAASAKTYTDNQITHVSKSINLFSAAIRSSNNIYVCDFNTEVTVSNGFSFKVQFNTTNTVVNTPTFLQVNGVNYHLRAEHFKNFDLPINFIDSSVVYEVVYLVSINSFVMNEVSRDADLRGGEVTVRVGKSASTAQFSTIQAAVDFLKKFNAGVRTIKIVNSTTSSVETFAGDITVKDFHGAPLYFSFDPRIRIEGFFNISDCSAEILINGNYMVPLEIVHVNFGIHIQNCSKLRLIYVNKTTSGYTFIRAIRVPVLHVSYCNISNQMDCFDITDGSIAYFDSIKGSNNTYGGSVRNSILTLNSYSVTSSNNTTSSAGLILK